jgi:hypothetical protein
MLSGGGLGWIIREQAEPFIQATEYEPKTLNWADFIRLTLNTVLPSGESWL